MERLTILGLLGGVGSGKSTVGRMFADHGAVVIDADRLAHECLERPAVAAAVAERFGPRAVGKDGRLDRAKLAERVFEDPVERAALEAIVHPCVKERIAERLEELERDGTARVAVLDVPLLLESGLTALCSHRVFVDAPLAERARRVRESRGWSAEELARREQAQRPLAEKRAAADFVVDNAGPLDAIPARVREILAAIARRPHTENRRP